MRHHIRSSETDYNKILLYFIGFLISSVYHVKDKKDKSYIYLAIFQNESLVPFQLRFIYLNHSLDFQTLDEYTFTFLKIMKMFVLLVPTLSSDAKKIFFALSCFKKIHCRKRKKKDLLCNHRFQTIRLVRPIKFNQFDEICLLHTHKI